MNITCEGPVAYVVDDDPRIRESIAELLESEGIATVGFESIARYRAFERLPKAACLILDVRLPDGTGLNLQTQLAGSDHPPIVFITGHADVATSVRAIKAGAIDFLIKPFGRHELVQAVRTACERDRSARIMRAEHARLLGRFSLLTPREREVLPLVASGLLNKQAAAILGISEVTLQIHRGHVMRKMAARSLPHLVRMADHLRISGVLTVREPDCASGHAGVRI
jgi:FixJ family two-component response regulator